MTAFFVRTVALSLIVFSIQSIHAQDTLVLFQKKNPSKEYKIPFRQYNIKVKCQGHKKFNGLLIGQKDSSLVFKIRHRDKIARRKFGAIASKAFRTADSLKYTNKQWDSLLVIVKNEENDALYPTMLILNTSQLKKINIDKHDRQEKKKQMLFLETMGFSIPIVAGIAFALDSPAIGITMVGFSIIWDVVYPTMKKKRIGLKKWIIKN